MGELMASIEYGGEVWHVYTQFAYAKRFKCDLGMGPLKIGICDYDRELGGLIFHANDMDGLCTYGGFTQAIPRLEARIAELLAKREDGA